MITAEEVRELLDYDPETGVFTWLPRARERFSSDRACDAWNARFAGKVANTITSYGYRGIKVNYRQYRAHRLAWLYVHGRWPSADIDHINGVRDDNRIANLREATRSVNLQNRRQSQPGSTSRYLGVGWNKEKQKWQAQIRLNYKAFHLGWFGTEDAAYQAYIEAKRRLHPGYVEACA